VCGFVALAAVESGGLSGLAFGLLVLPIMGLAVVGLPAFGIALAAGLAWVTVMRVVPSRWVGDPA
jgi:hypothetical protein